MYYTTHSPQHTTTTVFSNDFQGYEVMENAFLLKEQPHVLMHSIALSVSSFIRFKVFLMQSERFKSFTNALNVFSESSIHYSFKKQLRNLEQAWQSRALSI